MRLIARHLLLAASILIACCTGGSAAEEPGAVYVVIHIDVMPPYATQTADLLRRLVVDSVKDPGCISFQVLQQQGLNNHFVVLETWRDQPALDSHEMTDHTRQFRTALQSWIGSPFDERVHHLLQ